MKAQLRGLAWLALSAGLSIAPRNAHAEGATPPPASAAPNDTAAPSPATSAAAATPTTPDAAPTTTAAVPAPVIPSTAAAEPALPADTGSDSFTSEDTTESEQQHRLDLYGFADMTYLRLLVPQSSTWNRVYFPTNSFAVGNFNLYMGSNLGDGWRALGEVRFLYLPNGATSTDSAGNVLRTDTTVLDYAGFEQPIHWGAIRIERIWVEHEFSTLFKLQVGQFLTPYGIWNVDHGSPAIIGIRPPAVVAYELFPAHQTGLQLYGSTFFDPIEVGYNLTISNGRGPVEYVDFNDDKAVGGRLYVKTDAVGSLTFGTTAYRGGYYDRSAKYFVKNVNGQPIVDQQYTTISKYKELSLGADLKWQWKHFLVQGEAIMNQVKFANGARPRVQNLAPPNGFQPDYLRWGAYGLVGYRTPFVQTMPYAMVQYAFSPDNPIIPPILGVQFGLNIRPTPAVVLKTELTFTHFGGPGSGGLGSSPLRVWASQVAWAF
ncbi:MAG: hypothetical protein ABI488_20405 [Polyangiaceae bacterium]